MLSPTLGDVTESRDYEQATRTCQSYGAHLVSIESVEEQRRLASVLATQPGRRHLFYMLAVWRSGSVVRRMNEVALRWARLVLGWVTVFGRVYHLGM